VQLDDPLEPLARLGDERRRTGHVGMLAEAQRPGHQQARDRVGRRNTWPWLPSSPISVHLAVAREVTLDLPGDALGDPDLAHVDRVAELPRDAVGEGARIEVGRALEVVLRLRRVPDLPADAREPEHPQGPALVRVPDEIELAALEQQLVRVHLARGGLPGLHREVLELDALAAVDRRVDLGEARTDVMAAGRRGDAEPDRALLGRPERARAPPRDLLQGEPQRLGVRELAVEQRQRGLQGRQL
jgi:hypothetical protein